MAGQGPIDATGQPMALEWAGLEEPLTRAQLAEIDLALGLEREEVRA
jgi:hypothetical protein